MGNYELFRANPISTIPIGHAIFDPHFGLQAKLPLSKSTAIAGTIAYSGIYNSLYTLGFTSVAHL
jgi:photosystem I P700 chlorophyll a apoprotein A2